VVIVQERYIFASLRRLLVDLGQELVVAEQRVFFIADLDGAASELQGVSHRPLSCIISTSSCSTYLGNQDLIAGLHAWRHTLALLVECAGAHGEHFGFVELLDGRFRQEDAGCGFGFGLDALHENAVKERGDGAD
jgi:hypothetical protein